MFTPRERAEIHSALDKIITRHQWSDLPPQPRKSRRHHGGMGVWPSPEDYERIDARR
jgi:hypothetical protein